MALLTERVSVTMPAEQKARLKERARRRGISLGALMREVVDDQIALDDFNEWVSIYNQLEALRP